MSGTDRFVDTEVTTRRLDPYEDGRDVAPRRQGTNFVLDDRIVPSSLIRTYPLLSIVLISALVSGVFYVITRLRVNRLDSRIRVVEQSQVDLFRLYNTLPGTAPAPATPTKQLPPPLPQVLMPALPQILQPTDICTTTFGVTTTRDKMKALPDPWGDAQF